MPTWPATRPVFRPSCSRPPSRRRATPDCTSVWAAVRHLGAERIGHGVRSVEDPALLEHLAKRGITLDVALTSNTQTGASPSLRDHQIHALLAAGVPVTINTDDPRVSNVTLSQEHRTAVDEVGLTPEQLLAVAEQSVRAAFTDLGTVESWPSSTRQP